MRPPLVLLLVALVTVPVTGYVTFGRWPTGTLTYYINPTNVEGLAEDAVEAEIRAGADAWWTQSRATLRPVYGGRTTRAVNAYDGSNTMFFRDELVAGTLAVTYYWTNSAQQLLDADIVFYGQSAKYLTGTTPCTGSGIYVVDPATHEFGHVFGLSHAADATATMYYRTSYCSTNWRTLTADDIAGIEALYPPVPGGPPRPPTAVWVRED